MVDKVDKVDKVDEVDEVDHHDPVVGVDKADGVDKHMSIFKPSARTCHVLQNHYLHTCGTT